MAKKTVTLQEGRCEICDNERELIYVSGVGVCYECQKWLDRADDTNFAAAIDDQLYYSNGEEYIFD